MFDGEYKIVYQSKFRDELVSILKHPEIIEETEAAIRFALHNFPKEAGKPTRRAAPLPVYILPLHENEKRPALSVAYAIHEPDRTVIALSVRLRF